MISNTLQKVSRLLALASSGLIVACGGGAGSADSGSKTPSRAPANASIFFEFAKNVICADQQNRFYMIDNQYVFQDSAGSCADASYARVLYGATPNEILCSEVDSIAGPRSSCDGEYRSLFATINANRQSANLGLGAAHSVTPLQSGTSLAYRVLDAASNSGVDTAQNVVIKDSNAWAGWWAQHTRNLSPAPALPAVDFSRKMVVAVFAGKKPNGCFGIAAAQVERVNAVIKVSYLNTRPASDAVCTQSIVAPALLLEIDRSNDAVEFGNDRFGIALAVK